MSHGPRRVVLYFLYGNTNKSDQPIPQQALKMCEDVLGIERERMRRCISVKILLLEPQKARMCILHYFAVCYNQLIKLCKCNQLSFYIFCY